MMTPEPETGKKRKKNSEVEAAAPAEVAKAKQEPNTAMAALILTAVVGLTGHLATFGSAWIGQEKNASPPIVCHVEIREAVKLQQETGVLLPYSGEVEDKCQINDKLKALPTTPRP